MTMPRFVLQFVLPAAYALLPRALESPKASALLLAIALQESGCEKRRQIGGPARGLLQFELGVAVKRSGIAGLLAHPRSGPLLVSVMRALAYETTSPRVAYAAIEHNDILAFAAGRVNLLTLPQPLPDREHIADGWDQYVAAWQPGAARDPVRAKEARARWEITYPEAWHLVADPVSLP